MSELYFRLGKIEGFNASSVADKKEGYATPIRELLQNSLDASREANNGECKINIYIETISKSQIPHIDDYKKILTKAIETQGRIKSLNINANQVVKVIKKALEHEDITILMFSDNGIGMSLERINAIFDERSIKGGEWAGGSFGVGHLSSYSLSSLRYVLYATKYQDNGDIKTLFTGSPILAGYYDEGNVERGSSGRIVAEVPNNEKAPNFSYPEEFPDFIDPKMKKLDKGTMVAVLGLSEEWDDDAEYAIVSNFFHAIAHGTLSITVHLNGCLKVISYDEAERLIKARKEGQRKKGDSILSGKAVYQAWNAVVKGKAEGNDQKIKFKKIELENLDKVHVSIASDNNMDSVVVLVRNGMVIARHDSMLSPDIESLRRNDSNFEHFTVVIDVDQHDAPKLFTLVKGAENPYHNKLVKKRLDGEDQEKLKELFKELSKKIKEHLNKIERVSFDLPLFSVPNEAESQASGGKSSSGQDTQAKPVKSTKRPPRKISVKNIPNPYPRPRPVVISRNLEAQSAARYTDEGDKWKVQLRVTPKNMDAKDDVYLSMCVGEDNDKEEAGLYLDFMAAKINGKIIKISDLVEIKLGALKKSTQYNVTVEVKKPAEIGNMKVALLPILGLKQRKATKE